MHDQSKLRLWSPTALSLGSVAVNIGNEDTYFSFVLKVKRPC